MGLTKTARTIVAAVLSLSLLALFLGCSSVSTKYAGQTLTVKVTSFDGKTVAAETGELNETTGGGMSNGMTMPQNSAPNAPGMPTGSAPSMPSGASLPQIPSGFEVPSGASVPQNAGGPTVGASGNWPNGGNNMPGMNGMQNGSTATFTSSGEAISFSLADNTAIISENSGSAVFTSASEITIGSVLQVLFGSNGKPTAIIIKTVSGSSGSGNANFGGSSTVTNGTSANTVTEDSDITGTSYKSSGDDENALRIDGAKVNLTDITVNKSGGSSSNTENGDFYGQNAALLALNGSTVTIKNASVNSSAVNGNGIFSYGEGTVVNIYDTVIRTTERNSGGIQTTGGGTTNAYNLDVETKGASAAAIRSDRGGGTVNVSGGTYVTNGTGSPSIYSTADIKVSNATLTANNSEAIVIEGKNSISLENCTVTGNMSGTYADSNDEVIHNVMLYQSMSGDADAGNSSFSMKGGSLTAKTGDMFYVTNTSCNIALENVALKPATKVLLRVEGNSSSRGWGTAGANGGTCAFTATKQTMSGLIIVDSISSLGLTLSDGSSFTGAINTDGNAGKVNVTLSGDSTWTLTGNCYITSFTGDISDIVSNGYTIYVNGAAIN